MRNIVSSALGHEKKKPCFTGGRTFQVGSVGRDIFLKYIFFLFGGKNDSPKKTQKYKKKKKKKSKTKKKSDVFWRKNLEKYSPAVTFQKF